MDKQQLGKRQRRHDSDDSESSEEDQEYQVKRPRHDSDEEEEEEEVEDQQAYEEALLQERVRMELMEEEAFKHLTDEQIQALVN
jgi:hypothetical protein